MGNSWFGLFSPVRQVYYVGPIFEPQHQRPGFWLVAVPVLRDQHQFAAEEINIHDVNVSLPFIPRTRIRDSSPTPYVVLYNSDSGLYHTKRCDEFHHVSDFMTWCLTTK